MSGQGAPLSARDDAGVWQVVDPETLTTGEPVRVHFEGHTIEATFEGPGDRPGVYCLTLCRQIVDSAGFEYIAGPVA